MKKILFMLAAIILKTAVFAQPPGGGKMPAAANIGHVYGKLIDSAGKPVSDASVILLQNRFDTVSKK